MTWSNSETPRKKPSGLVGVHERPAVDDELGSLRDPPGDPLDDRGPVLCRVDGTHVHPGLHARADLEPGDAPEDERPEPVRSVADGDHERLGHAPLAGGAVARGHARVGGHRHVGVGQHDHRVLGARVGPDPLAVVGARLEDVAADRGRADELDGPDVRVLDERRDRLAPAVDDVEGAVGAAGLAPELGLEL